eukprot:SAG31_NODE_4444_length_3225_cov_2.086052_3_plen_72_part_00
MQTKDAIASAVVLLDTRADTEWTGAKHVPPTARRGTIPSSVHLEWLQHLTVMDARLVQETQQMMLTRQRYV